MMQGAQIAILDIAETQSEHIPPVPTIKYFKCNISDSSSVDSTIKAVADAFGHIDILVNCAGVMDGMERPDALTNEKWDKVMSVNVNGPFYTTRAVVPYFLKNERTPLEGSLPEYDIKGQQHEASPPSKGVIVNIASAAAMGGASAGAAYTASKHALLGLSRSTSWGYRNDGIRCNTVLPGGVATNIYQNSGAYMDETGYAKVKPYHDLQPERLLGGGDIASAVLWLAMPVNKNINGAEVVVDGAWGVSWSRNR